LKKILKKISIFLLVAYVVIGALLFSMQRSLLYFPTPNFKTPYEKLLLHNDGESINVIVLNEGHPNAILYFGGNAESMARSSDEIAKQFSEFTVYLMNYRGFGGSTGEPTEQGIYSDALKLYDTVRSKHQNVFVGGRSLGTGVATYVAANRDISRLILVTPYDSIVNVAQDRYKIYPISLLIKDAYDSVDRVKNIKAKTLIFIAGDDKVIPRKNTQKLIDAFDKTQLKVILIKNRGHIDISSDKRYYRSMREFMK